METGLFVRAFPCRNRRPEGHVALLLIEAQRAVTDDQMIDQRNLHALIVGCVQVQHPTQTAVLGGDQHHFRLGYNQARHLDTAGQQSAQPNGGLKVRDLQRVPLQRPVRAADPQSPHLRRGGPAEQIDVEVAVELDLAVILRRGPRTDRPAQPVPLEQGEEEHEQGENQEGPAGGDRLGAARTAQPAIDRIVGDDPVPPLARPCAGRDEGPVAHDQPVRIVFQGVGQAETPSNP